MSSVLNAKSCPADLELLDIFPGHGASETLDVMMDVRSCERSVNDSGNTNTWPVDGLHAPKAWFELS